MSVIVQGVMLRAGVMVAVIGGHCREDERGV